MNFDASHTTTSREGRELDDTTNEVKPKKIAYQEKTIAGHNDRRGEFHKEVERELNTPAGKIKTTTTQCDELFCFWERIQLVLRISH